MFSCVALLQIPKPFPPFLSFLLPFPLIPRFHCCLSKPKPFGSSLSLLSHVSIVQAGRSCSILFSLSFPISIDVQARQRLCSTPLSWFLLLVDTCLEHVIPSFVKFLSNSKCLCALNMLNAFLGFMKIISNSRPFVVANDGALCDFMWWIEIP